MTQINPMRRNRFIIPALSLVILCFHHSARAQDSTGKADNKDSLEKMAVTDTTAKTVDLDFLIGKQKKSGSYFEAGLSYQRTRT